MIIKSIIRWLTILNRVNIADNKTGLTKNANATGLNKGDKITVSDVRWHIIKTRQKHYLIHEIRLKSEGPHLCELTSCVTYTSIEIILCGRFRGVRVAFNAC